MQLGPRWCVRLLQPIALHVRCLRIQKKSICCKESVQGGAGSSVCLQLKRGEWWASQKAPAGVSSNTGASLWSIMLYNGSCLGDHSSRGRNKVILEVKPLKKADWNPRLFPQSLANALLYLKPTGTVVRTELCPDRCGFLIVVCCFYYAIKHFNIRSCQTI